MNQTIKAVMVLKSINLHVSRHTHALHRGFKYKSLWDSPRYGKNKLAMPRMYIHAFNIYNHQNYPLAVQLIL